MLPTWSWARTGLGSPARTRALDSMILGGPFQLETLCGCHRWTRRRWRQPGLSARGRGLAASAVSCAGAGRTGRWPVSALGSQRRARPGRRVLQPCPERLGHQHRTHRLGARFALSLRFSHPELVTEEEGMQLTSE